MEYESLVLKSHLIGNFTLILGPEERILVVEEECVGNHVS